MSRRRDTEQMRHLAAEALTQYALQPAALSLLELGLSYSSVFKVTDTNGARYVLRVSGATPAGEIQQTRARLASELWWLGRLRADLGAPVPAIVTTREDREIAAVTAGSEERLCTLFHWMDGRFLNRGLRSSHLEQVGRLMARLHDHSAQLTVPAAFIRGRVDSADEEMEEQVTRLFRDSWSEEAAVVMRDVVRHVRRVQEDLGDSPDVFGLIHADIHQFNYLFARGKIRLIDFDDSGWGHYLYDPAVTLNVLGDHARYQALREALLAGYRQIRPLSPEHEVMIESFYMLREVQDISSFLAERDTSTLRRFAGHIAPGLALLERFLRERITRA